MPQGMPVARTAGVLACALGLVAGCQSTARRTPYADNPLLMSRQPLQVPPGTAGGQRLEQIAQAGPRTVVPPPLIPASPAAPPASAVALAKNAPDARAVDNGPILPALPTIVAEQPSPLAAAPWPEPTRLNVTATSPAPQPLAVAALPAPELDSLATQPSTGGVALASARRAEGKFGAARDHSWLQGELDRHYRGYLDLRYCPASEEDTFGGKVRLENDPRLADFRAGDIVIVEGELIRDPPGTTGSLTQYPRYHIRDIRLVERR